MKKWEKEIVEGMKWSAKWISIGINFGTGFTIAMRMMFHLW